MNYLVIDVGGTAIKYALMDKDSNFIEKGDVPTPKTSLEDFISTICAIREKFGEVAGVAMSMPGRIDSDHGYAFSAGERKYYAEMNVREIFEAKFNLKVSIENDAKCAALAEAAKGSLADCPDGIVVILGTGVGGGIIKDGQLHKGKDFIAGELSYLLANMDGNKGDDLKIFGYVCGVPKGLCLPFAEKKGLTEDEVDGRYVFDLVSKGDEDAIEALDNYCYKLSLMLMNLQHIYDPDKIAIGGGISASDILFDYLENNFKYLEENLEMKLTMPEIVKCEFRNDANLIGALSHFKNLYEK